MEDKAKEIVEVERKQISVEKNGKKFIFVFDADSSLGDLYDASYTVLSVVHKAIQEIVQKAAPKEDEPSKEERPKFVE